MKRTAKVIAGLLLFFGVPLFAVVHAEVKMGAPLPPADARVTRMKAAGTVTGISDTAISIERTVKGNMETMEFVLEKPVSTIIVGDKVQVSYVQKEDKNIATRVTKTIVKKPIPKTTINVKPSRTPTTVPAAK